MCGLIPAVLMPGASRGAEKRASAGGGGGERNAEDQERMILIQVMRLGSNISWIFVVNFWY